MTLPLHENVSQATEELLPIQQPPPMLQECRGTQSRQPIWLQEKEGKLLCGEERINPLTVLEHRAVKLAVSISHMQELLEDLQKHNEV